MGNNHQHHENLTAVLPLWRRAGVDFDCGAKSTLPQLLEIGGYFPLSKVKDRLPLSRHFLYQLSREHDGGEFASCVVPIRANGRTRATAILVDLVRLNRLLSAQILSRHDPRPKEPQPKGESLFQHLEFE